MIGFWLVGNDFHVCCDVTPRDQSRASFKSKVSARCQKRASHWLATCEQIDLHAKPSRSSDTSDDVAPVITPAVARVRCSWGSLCLAVVYWRRRDAITVISRYKETIERSDWVITS